MMSLNINCLMTTPATDCNFRSALKRATIEEIRATIAQLDGKKNVKTKIAALERELRKREKQKPKNITDAAMKELFS